MAEISHPEIRNFSPSGLFKYIETKSQEDERRPIVSTDLGSVIPSPVRGSYALFEVCRDIGRVDGAACVFAGAGFGRDRSWSRSWIRGRATCLHVWLLRLLSLRVRALWVLWAKLLRRWNFYRSGPLVSLGTSGMVLGSRVCGTRLGLGSRRLAARRILRSRISWRLGT